MPFIVQAALLGVNFPHFEIIIKLNYSLCGLEAHGNGFTIPQPCAIILTVKPMLKTFIVSKLNKPNSNFGAYLERQNSGANVVVDAPVT